ncbi:MAG: aldo/keto reductase, partial [Deltaproteobacteria bacterium]|nr:aldo/keto reductase [Deltaproteobacteria bacterium]
QMVKMAGIAARYHLESPVAAQCIYNLVHRELEREVIPAAIDQGMGILCYSALGGGLLTGKYSGMKAPSKGTRLSYRSEVDGPRFWNPRGLQTADILNKISTSSGVPITTLAIAWPLKRRFVTSVIIGARNLQQLEANLEAANWDIPDSLFNKLEKKTRPDEEYMTWFTKRNYDRFFAAADFHDEESELP